MSRKILKTETYQQQSRRMTQLGRKVMYNEFKRLGSWQQPKNPPKVKPVRP